MDRVSLRDVLIEDGLVRRNALVVDRFGLLIAGCCRVGIVQSMSVTWLVILGALAGALKRIQGRWNRGLVLHEELFDRFLRR